MENTLGMIAELFNKNNIHWAVGGSLMLQHYNLITKPNDIDIIVSLQDIHQADKLLLSLGNKKKQTSKKEFATAYFYQYELSGINVDVMVDFAIVHSKGIYTYPFDQHSIIVSSTIQGIPIPYCALEDWYVLYQLMENRQVKVKLIFDYLNANKKNTLLLERALLQDIPKTIKENIESLIQP
jgi:hypothetical protein